MENLKKDKIGIYKYSSCNTSSIANALNMIKANYFISDKFSEINKFSKIILPGVGNMKNIPQNYLKNMKIDINQYIQNGGIIYGICLGLQILFDESMESNTETLGIINGKVLPVEDYYKIGLNVGFHKIEPHENLKNNNYFSKLFSKIDLNDRLYFLHKYYCNSVDKKVSTLNIKINNKFMPIAFQKGNVIGTQFHPELSKEPGLKILKNFIEI